MVTELFEYPRQPTARLTSTARRSFGSIAAMSASGSRVRLDARTAMPWRAAQRVAVRIHESGPRVAGGRAAAECRCACRSTAFGDRSVDASYFGARGASVCQRVRTTSDQRARAFLRALPSCFLDMSDVSSLLIRWITTGQRMQRFDERQHFFLGRIEPSFAGSILPMCGG